MEYQRPTGEWVPVPTAENSLGEAYTSEHYPGLRDFVSLKGVTEYTQRHISFFMPYDAAAMHDGTYLRRYVIRLWNKNDQDVARTTLTAEKVTINNQSGRTIIKVVECKACCAAMAASEGPLEPMPEVVSTGTVQFFDAKTGHSFCPEAEQKPQK
jgi:hypothetical protein